MSRYMLSYTDPRQQNPLVQQLWEGDDLAEGQIRAEQLYLRSAPFSAVGLVWMSNLDYARKLLSADPGHEDVYLVYHLHDDLHTGYTIGDRTRAREILGDDGSRS